VAAIAKGHAELIISEDETEAKILFTPDTEEGLGWDPDAILKLCREKNLNPLPVPSEVETFISKASRAKEPMEKTLVFGTPAEPPVGEIVKWEALPVPSDIAAFQEEVLSGAKVPRIIRTRIEKVKRNTLVKKPGKIPFMPAKEEVVAVWDKKEIREPVEVDPEVTQVHYAGRNKKLGILEAAKPGKPGKSVFGKPIQAIVLPDSDFHLGPGIRREKNELHSDYAGFIRIGKNWADIVPSGKPDWEITLGSDGVTRFLHFSPGNSHFAAPSGEEILAKAREQGAADGLVSAAAIDAAIAQSTKSGEQLTAFSLITTQKAEARVDITADQVKADLFLHKGVAGAEPLELATISKVIRDSKVHGFNIEELKKTIHVFMASHDSTLRYTLVEGKTATRGADKEITLCVQPMEGEEKTALLDRLGQLKRIPDARQGFPFSEAEILCFIEKDAQIAQINHPPGGEEGKDIYGNIIPVLPGNDPELKLFRGLRENGGIITADASGLLLAKGPFDQHLNSKVFYGMVIDCRDAHVTVQVSEDNMEASVTIVSDLGPGRPLEEAMVYSALKEAGVTRGINTEALETACKLAILNRGSITQVLARGEAPVTAGGMEIKWNLPGKNPGSLFRQEKAGGVAIIPVNAGVVVASVKTSKETKNGFDVTGTELKAEPEAGENFTWDATILVREAGGIKTLIAAQGGELTFDGKNLSINSLKEILDVDNENVQFSGEVRVAGNVRPGFSVVGGKDVHIGGSAEEALVSAGGKAVILQGIKGGGRGIIRARTRIETIFAERAVLLAVEDIRVKCRCIVCNVKTNGKLILSELEGILAGGVILARRGISTAELGGDDYGETQISFGQDYLIKDQIEAAEQELVKINAALIKAETELREAAGRPILLESAGAEKVRLLKSKEQYSLRVFTLREKFEEHHESAVMVKGIIHPGVVMESHGRYYEITEKRRGVAFSFDQETGRIVEKKL